MSKCKQGVHEFEWITKACGCEYEVCYRSPHEVRVSTCDWCRREDKEE